MRAKENERDSDSLHIVNQRRLMVGMAYHLACNGQQLTLKVTPRSSVEDVDEWRVEAQASRPPESPVVVVEWGPTRLAAVQAVGRAWELTVAGHGPAMFDWEHVARVLAVVRAV